MRNAENIKDIWGGKEIGGCPEFGEAVGGAAGI
jgi:hypothetical protein